MITEYTYPIRPRTTYGTLTWYQLMQRPLGPRFRLMFRSRSELRKYWSCGCERCAGHNNPFARIYVN